MDSLHKTRTQKNQRRSLCPVILDIRRKKKWEPIHEWLFKEYGVRHANLSDLFRITNNPLYPGFYNRLLQDKEHFVESSKTIDSITLRKYWSRPVKNDFDSRLQIWLEMTEPFMEQALGAEKKELFLSELLEGINL